MASPTSRPLTAKGQATRTRILDCAAELMYEHGVAMTSVDEVKAAAGVSSSQLYHYFTDKSALVTAVIDRQIQSVLGFQEPHLVAVEDLATLRAWRDAVIATVAAHGGLGGCPIGSLASELSNRDDHQRMVLADAFGRWESVLCAGLGRMREGGEMPDGVDPDHLALALLAALQGGLLLSQIRRSTRPLEIALDEVIARIGTAAA